MGLSDPRMNPPARRMTLMSHLHFPSTSRRHHNILPFIHHRSIGQLRSNPRKSRMMMKCSLVVAALLLGRIEAFVATSHRPAAARSFAPLSGGAVSELGLPCEDDCAITKYPNLPASVHPGVLSGQAQLDLLNHAKENGQYHLLYCFID
jgi:hypothetical protein